MGVVWLADDTRLRRKVALKFLSPEASRNPMRRRRFDQEARAAAALSHPGIATVYELVDLSGQLFIVFEYIPGSTLRSSITSGGLPAKELISMAWEIADALAAAHAAGVVHRDLKPENVMRTPAGSCKILDFGLARLASPDITDGLTQSANRQTATGALVGTLRYMAPEQIEGQHVDFRADIFAFGVLVYELATGMHPFESKSSPWTIGAIFKNEPIPLSKRTPAHSKELARIIEKCLRKVPSERYQSTCHLARDLAKLKDEAARSSNELVTSASEITGIPPQQNVRDSRKARYETSSIAVLPFVNMSP